MLLAYCMTTRCQPLSKKPSNAILQGPGPREHELASQSMWLGRPGPAGRQSWCLSRCRHPRVPSHGWSRRLHALRRPEDGRRGRGEASRDHSRRSRATVREARYGPTRRASRLGIGYFPSSTRAPAWRPSSPTASTRTRVVGASSPSTNQRRSLSGFRRQPLLAPT